VLLNLAASMDKALATIDEAARRGAQLIVFPEAFLPGYPTWDCGETWTASMSHIAREGGCWVLSSATALESSDIPADFPGREALFPDDGWINPGDAIVVKPSGGLAAGPLHRDKSLLITELDLDRARRARKPLDVAGHYGRPDLFHLRVDRRPQRPVAFDDAAG